MKNRNVGTANTRLGFKRMVELKVEASASLPTMSFETSRNYYKHLEKVLVSASPEIADNLSAQYRELSDIFGIKPNVSGILQKRYEKSGLQCGFENLKEYLGLLMSQRADMADASKNYALENEIQKVEFCSYL